MTSILAFKKVKGGADVNQFDRSKFKHKSYFKLIQQSSKHSSNLEKREPTSHTHKK